MRTVKCCFLLLIDQHLLLVVLFGLTGHTGRDSQSHPAAPWSGTSMKPMSWLWCSLFSHRFWLWRRGRLGCSILDCCLSREPRNEADALWGAGFCLEWAAERQKQQRVRLALTAGYLEGFCSGTRVKLAGGHTLMANVATLSVVLPCWSYKANTVRWGCDTRESSGTSARPYWSFLVDPVQWRPAGPSQWASG